MAPFSTESTATEAGSVSGGAGAPRRGWFTSVDDDGPVDARKAAYPHSFVVLAAASATAAGRPGWAELL